MAPKRPAFRTLSAPTAPNADDPASATSPAPDVTTPGRPDVTTPSPSAKPGRIAFTRRLTPDEANRVDDLVLRMRRDLGLARLDRAAVLTALCRLAETNPAVYGAVLGQLQDA